jgi:L-ascorbate metabolism protein UlaG (beta-lactamase superfamily)
MNRLLLHILPLLMVLFSGCSSIVARFMAKSVNQAGNSVERVQNKIQNPVLPEVHVAVLWVGHATMLVQIHDKVFITDPLFTKTVGMVMKRAVEPGIDPSSLGSVDYVLISHTHFDHFSYGSLDMLPKNGSLLVPLGALAYTPDLGFNELREMKPWDVVEREDVRITAVPVQHFSGRYGFDILWLRNRGYTGYVIEYRGATVFFGGDTGYDPELFKEIGRRFDIDIAILPIGPIEPRDFMERNHVDPLQALRIFEDVRARVMIPMHHRTLDQGFDPSPTYAIEQLRVLSDRQGIAHRVFPLEVGEQRIFPESAFSSEPSHNW